MTYTDSIIAFASDNPALVGLVIFLSAFAEAIVLVGALVPGAALVIVLAGVVGAGRGAVMPLIAWATAGALAGDGLAYWIGLRFGPQLRERWPFRLKPELFDRGNRFFSRHGAKSLIIGRFIPGIRAITPVAAGTLGMRPWVFIPASATAALLWALVHVVPAAGAGVLLSAVGRISSRLIGAAFGFVVLVALAVWFARLAVNVVGPHVITGYGRLVYRMVRSDRALLRRIGRLLDPTVANIAAHIAWGSVLLLCAIGVVGIVQDLVAGEPLVQADATVRQLAQTFRAAPLDGLMVIAASLGDTIVAASSFAILAAALFAAGARRTAAIVATVFTATVAFLPLIGLAFDQHRPMDLVPEFIAFSFPSSHATFAALFCGVSVVLLSTGIPAPFRIAGWAVGFFISALVALSRVYLDAQWASDVVAGLLLGLALTAVFAMIRNGFQDEVGRRPQIAMIGFSAYLAIGMVESSMTFDADLARSAPRAAVVEMAEPDWLAGEWKILPQRRIDLFGETEEPMLLQTAVDPAALAPALAGLAWQRAGAFAATDLFYFLVPAAPLDSFPPLPLLHGGRPPEVTFVRPTADPDKRLVLRFWPTNFLVRSDGGRRALMVGSVTEERVAHPYQAMTVLLDRAADPPAVDEVRASFAGAALPTVAVSQRPSPAGSVFLLAPVRPGQ